MGKLEGRVAIVTGSGRGIGRAIAAKLAGEGARIVVNDLDEGPAAETAEMISAAGGEALVCAGDVTGPEFGERIVGAALDGFGGLHIIVNNAGYIWNTAVHNTTDAQWAAMLDVHATAPFRVLRAAAAHIREQAGREREAGEIVCRKVVNVSSVSGIFGAATQIAYAAAKSALIGVTKTLAKEWGRHNVTVNCVAFGHVATRLTQPFDADGRPRIIEVMGRDHRVGLSAESIETLHALTPLGRGGTVEEAAGAVYLFCIPESDFITGEVLVCSGGLTI